MNYRASVPVLNYKRKKDVILYSTAEKIIALNIMLSHDIEEN